MTDSLREKPSPVKGIAIILIAFLLVSLITVAIMYFSNESFRYTSNDFLTLLPGRIGGYFRELPTKEEKENTKLQIAKYYIALEEDRLIDKLLIVKGDDNDLYNELLILLSKENPMKMRNIKEKLRNLQLQPSLLSRIVEEIDQDKMIKIKELTDYYTSLKITDAILEIERTYKTGELDSKEPSLLFENLSTELSAKLLMHLDTDLATRVLYGLKEEPKKQIEKKMHEITIRQNELIELANIYEKESLEKNTNDLGTIDQYNSQDLAVIYKHMSIQRGGQILATVNDNDFITSLYENINIMEMLNRESPHLSAKLAEAVQIYKNYDAKVKELVGIYEKISLQELTNIIEEMAKSNMDYQSYSVGSEEIIFTEEQLVLDILSQLKPNKAAQLLEQLKTQRSVDLSKKYVMERKN